MRYSSEHSEQTRQRILDAAGREFRARGFGGVGVDALAKAAGVTSGAFYSHFRSKAEAFRAVTVAGLERLRKGVAHFRGTYGENWLDAFVTYYLSPGHRQEVADSCALPSLSSGVGRADESTRAAYEAELLQVAAAVANGMAGAGEGTAAQREAAWPVLAQLVGGVLLARAVQDEVLAREIADTVRRAVLTQAQAQDAQSSPP